MPVRWKVEVTGLRQVMDALKEMDKKAYREITKVITSKAKDVQWAAATSVPGNPVSGWGPWTDSGSGRDLGFSPSAVASGFKVQRNNYRRRGVSAGISWDVVQMDPAGAIFEVVGDFTRIRTDSGRRLVEKINDRFPMPKKGTRLLTRAYYKAIPDSQALAEQIRDSIIESARANGLR